MKAVAHQCTTFGRKRSSSPPLNTILILNGLMVVFIILYTNTEKSYTPVEDVRSYKVNQKYARAHHKK